MEESTQSISAEIVTSDKAIEEAVIADVMAVIPDGLVKRYDLTDKKILALGFAAKARMEDGAYKKATAREIAAFAGVNVNTVYKWRGQPWWNSALREIALQSVGSHIPYVLESLSALAEMGDTKAIKMFLEMTGFLGAGVMTAMSATETPSIENYLKAAEDESGEIPLGDYYEY